MKFGTIFVMMIIFVFTALLFPTLQEECLLVNSSLTVAPLIKVFPYIFLSVMVLVALYYGVKERD